MTAAVRRATIADCDELTELIRAHAEYEKSVATVTVARLGWLLSHNRPPATLLVAEGCEGLIGYAALTFDFSVWRGCRWAHMDCLFVRADKRSSGVGKRLLEAVVEKAREAGADQLEWQTPDWNENAARFYKREGAIESAKRRFCRPLR